MLISLVYYSYVRFDLRFRFLHSSPFLLTFFSFFHFQEEYQHYRLKKKKNSSYPFQYILIYFYFCGQKACYDIYLSRETRRQALSL